MKTRLSLESRICILVGGLLFALLLAVGYVQMSSYKTRLMKEKVEEYQGLSSMLALIYKPLNGRANLSQYHEFTTRFMKADPDISFVMIADSRGEVIYANTREQDPRRRSNFVGHQMSRVIALLRGKDDVVGTTFRIPATVRPGERGTISVGFVAHSIDSALDDTQSSLLYTFALALMVGFCGALLIAKAMTMPMRQLISAARRVASGDLDVQIPKTANDEAGAMVDTFNDMIASLKLNRDKLVERANTDSLTGLHNHRFFQERLRSELKRAKRYEHPLSVIMIDIDDFKVLNDTHGHPLGDSVLQEVAEILVGGARGGVDVVCRYGGEEFAIIVPETRADDAMVIAERIRDSVANHTFTGSGGTEVSATISLGIAEFPVHSRERERLIAAADLALYQSKSMGKNRTTVFSSKTQAARDSDMHKLYLLVNASDISTVEAMAAAVDAKGQRSPGHSRAVMDHAVLLARDLGMTEEEQRDVRIASLLRDIGKLGISATVLNKPGPLTQEELDLIKGHATMGYSVVQKSPYLKPILRGILSHHERWDGTGYPKRLTGEDIPVIARVIAVIDAYHAMLATRPYSDPKSVQDARAELLKGAGTQFDPRIVEMFIRILELEDSAQKAA